MRYGICGTVNKRYDMTHRHFLRGLLLVLLSVWGMKAESAGLEENGEVVCPPRYRCHEGERVPNERLYCSSGLSCV